jgi:hypothetical protein
MKFKSSERFFKRLVREVKTAYKNRHFINVPLIFQTLKKQMDMYNVGGNEGVVRVAAAVRAYPSGPPSRHVERPFRLDAREEPERLYGTEKAETFLRRHLLGPVRKYAEIPVQNILLLYGRKGAGKSTLLHKVSRGGGRTFMSSFSTLLGWKLRPWDRVEEFEAFIKDAIARAVSLYDNYALAKTQGMDPVRNRMLIVIWNAHHLANSRDQTGMFELVRLMTMIKIQALSHRSANADGIVRVVLVSDAPPNQLPGEVRQLIDADQFVGNMEAQDRRAFLVEHMRRFQSLATREPEFAKLGWNVDLSEDAISDDPDHIVNQLTVASHGCTPWEMTQFMERLNLACSTPSEDGSTQYSADFIETLLYKTNGAGRTITPHNPATLNLAFSRYLGINFNALDYMDGSAPGRPGGAAEAALDLPILSGEERDAKKKRSLNEMDAEMGEALSQLAARTEAEANKDARKRHREEAFGHK